MASIRFNFDAFNAIFRKLTVFNEVWTGANMLSTYSEHRASKIAFVSEYLLVWSDGTMATWKMPVTQNISNNINLIWTKFSDYNIPCIYFLSQIKDKIFSHFDSMLWRLGNNSTITIQNKVKYRWYVSKLQYNIKTR